VKPKTFDLVEDQDRAGAVRGIRCLVCGLLSWNPSDRDARYCGRGHRFHEDPAAHPDAVRGRQMIEENRRANQRRGSEQKRELLMLALFTVVVVALAGFCVSMALMPSCAAERGLEPHGGSLPALRSEHRRLAAS
jgi:hypothetical protein